MEELSCFELAGYTKEESEKLMEVCHDRGMDYNQMLKFLGCFGTCKDKAFEDFCKNGKSPLKIAWNKLIESIAETLKIYKILDWLSDKLSRFKQI